MRAVAFALILLFAGCATQPPPAPAAAEPAPPAPPPPAADADPAEPPAAPPRGNAVATRTETRTRSESFSVKLPEDLETDIPCTATGIDRFMAALFVRVRNRLQLPPGYQAVMPGRPAAATVKLVIEVPPSGEPLGAKLSATSGIEALDRAVLAAVDKAKCMPPPPAQLIDSKTRTFRITEPFGFERTN